MPPGYEQARDQEQLRALQPAIRNFVARYLPGRPTIILLPGGFGSQLRRSDRAYVPGQPTKDFHYRTSWISATICSDASDLAMNGERDFEDRFNVAEGAVLFNIVTPYERFKRWAFFARINTFVYGWDWRRRLQPMASFFDRVFLPALQAAVIKAHGSKADPLDGFTIVGHSFGGPFLYTWLNEPGAMVDKLGHGVTIGSPLYGYCGQIHRYFAGFAMLNGSYSKTELSRICASTLGGYMLLPLAYATWQRDCRAFLADDYKLYDYPMKDAIRPAIPVDPYKPLAGAGMVRYPTASWFIASELSVASKLRSRLATPLPAATLKKIHNWRAVQTGLAPHVPLAGTIWSQSWKEIPRGFNPDTDNDPITDHYGPGDGTVAAWGARFAFTPKANVRTFTGASDALEHGFLLENAEILWALLKLVDPDLANRVSVAEMDRELGPVEMIAEHDDPRVSNWLQCRSQKATHAQVPVGGTYVARVATNDHAVLRRVLDELSRF